MATSPADPSADSVCPLAGMPSMASLALLAGGGRDTDFMGERTVNARQLEVLEWIVAGCPGGVMTGVTFKTTAVALQNRRLATVTKRRGVWRAVPTEAGRFFVKHGAYPAGHWSATSEPAPRPATPATPATLATPATPATPAIPAVPGGGRERRATGLRPVDQMMADLAAAGGQLEVAAEWGGYWENLAASATR